MLFLLFIVVAVMVAAAAVRAVVRSRDRAGRPDAAELWSDALKPVTMSTEDSDRSRRTLGQA